MHFRSYFGDELAMNMLIKFYNFFYKNIIFYNFELNFYQHVHD